MSKKEHRSSFGRIATSALPAAPIDPGAATSVVTQESRVEQERDATKTPTMRSPVQQRAEVLPGFLQLERGGVPYEQIRVVSEHLVRPVVTSEIPRNVDSIDKYGLFHPLMLDRSNELVAGLQRYTAIGALRSERPEVFELRFPNGIIPTIRLPVAYDEDPDLVRSFATIENRHRRAFTKQEIQTLVSQVRQGSGVVQRRGRLAEGERSLADELAFVLRMSKGSVKRLLANAGETRNAGTTITTVQTRTRTLHRRIDREINELLDLLGSEHRDVRERIHSLRSALDDAIQLVQ